MGPTQTFAEFAAGTTFDDLPPDVRDRAAYFFFDFIGIAARGALMESSRALRRTLDAVGAPPGAFAAIGTGVRTLAPYAALLNGTAAHSLELDDTNQEGSIHPGAAVWPAALAAAQLRGAGGRELLLGGVLGYELDIRLARALDPIKHYARGFHPTGTCGVFGATVAAGRILGLRAPELAGAIGIAGSMAAGSMEFLADGAWTKRLHAGWAAQGGLLAALMAQQGFRGPREIIAGRDGFLRAYTDGGRADAIVEALGAEYQILRTSIKPHSCCRYKQPPVDAILELRARHGLGPADIRSITVGLPGVALPIIAEPSAQKRRPATPWDAQFSMPYGAAVALVKGRASLDEYTPDLLADATVRGLMDRVICVRSAEMDQQFPKRWGAVVDIETVDGRTLRARVDQPKGDPENPLSWAELEAKFRGLTAPVYTAARQTELIAAIRTLVMAPTLAPLHALLGSDRGDGGDGGSHAG